jgi:hypothetical protein
VEQKLLQADREKVWFFLNQIFSAVRNFKFRHMVCRNKKFCSVKSRFPVHLPLIKILDNIGSPPVISWAISMKLSNYYFFHAHLRMCQVSWKNIQK